MPNMRLLSRLLLLLSVASAGFLTSCETARTASTGGPYRVTAKRPQNPANVKVKVSLSKQNIYVMEGERVLMAVATTVGTRENPTPKGTFRVYKKIENKRSNTYGFRVQGDRIIPAKSSAGIPGVTWAIRWAIGSSSSRPTGFTRDSSIPRRGATAACA